MVLAVLIFSEGFGLNESILLIDYRVGACGSDMVGGLFTFGYSARANLLKTKLQTCNLQTGQSISYKNVNQF